MMLPTLNNERIMVGAQCLSAIDGVLEDALEYSMQRKAFGKPIGRFQAIQHYIADIATWQQPTELLLYYISWLQSTGQHFGVQAKLLKMVEIGRASFRAKVGKSG